MDKLEFNRQMEEYLGLINEKLIEYLPEAKDGQSDVVRAMKYSLINGGKRLRPILVLEFCKACGGDIVKAIPFACAIEYVHTYSLIHDDLPCMDDDDLRRGNPSCHKMFGESTALLAGDALLTHAFEIICDAEINSSYKADAVCLLAQNAGVGGMLGGQVLDLKYESACPSISQLLTVHKLKTGALISAACLLGCIAGEASDSQLASASKFAYNLGIAFQIKDDLLDVLGDEEKLGKPIGSDAQNDKVTYVSLVGIDKAQNDVEMLTSAAVEQLYEFRYTDFIETLANALVQREF